MYHRFLFSTNGWEFKLLERGVKSTADLSSEIKHLYFTAANFTKTRSYLRTLSRSGNEFSGISSKHSPNSLYGYINNPSISGFYC